MAFQAGRAERGGRFRTLPTAFDMIDDDGGILRVLGHRPRMGPVPEPIALQRPRAQGEPSARRNGAGVCDSIAGSC